MPNKKDDHGFTNTEVMSLFESLKFSVEVVAERVGSLQGDVAILKEDVSILKTDVRLIKDTLRVAIPSLDKRVTQLELKAAG